MWCNSFSFPLCIHYWHYSRQWHSKALKGAASITKKQVLCKRDLSTWAVHLYPNIWVCMDTLCRCKRDGMDSSQLRGQTNFGLSLWCSGAASCRECLSCRWAAVGPDKHALTVPWLRGAIWRRRQNEHVPWTKVSEHQASAAPRTLITTPQVWAQTFPAAACSKPPASSVLE